MEAGRAAPDRGQSDGKPHVKPAAASSPSSSSGPSPAPVAAKQQRPAAAPTGGSAVPLGARLVVGHSLLSVVLFAIAFEPVGLFPSMWLALVPWLVVIRDASTRAASIASFFTHLGQGALVVHWLTLLGVPPWAGTAVGYGLYGLFFCAIARPLLLWGRIPAVLWLPPLLVALEHLQGRLFFFAFPWTWLGHSQYKVLPLIQVADLGGATVVSFIVAAGNAFVLDALAIRGGRYGLLTRRERRRMLLARAAVPVGLVAAALIYGAVRMATIPLADGPRILAVQSNLPQSVKNETDRVPERRLEMCKRLTEKAEGEGIDLIVWPETMVPVEPVEKSAEWPLDFLPLDQSDQLLAVFRKLGQRMQAPFLVGGFHAEVRDGRVREHNSAYYLSPAGHVLGRYDKIYLAPVSEYAPFVDSWPAAHAWIRGFVPEGFSQFEPGAAVHTFDLVGMDGRRWRFAANVCFDITFARQTIDAARNGVDFVVNISNYAWFQDSAELDLARAHTIFRAVETRTPMASAVNAGISHFVDPLGRAKDYVHPSGKKKEVEGLLLEPLQVTPASSIYVRVGDLWAWLNVGASAALVLAAVYLGRRDRSVMGG